MGQREHWVIWVCRCPGVLWAERPRHHVTCAQCGALIRQITVVRL